ELAVDREKYAGATKAWREAEALTAPPPVLLEEISEARGTRQIWGMGDSVVWTLAGHPFDAERQQALLSGWRRKRYLDLGFELPPYSYKMRIDAVTDRLAKIERKLAALMF